MHSCHSHSEHRLHACDSSQVYYNGVNVPCETLMYARACMHARHDEREPSAMLLVIMRCVALEAGLVALSAASIFCGDNLAAFEQGPRSPYMGVWAPGVIVAARTSWRDGRVDTVQKHHFRKLLVYYNCHIWRGLPVKYHLMERIAFPVQTLYAPIRTWRLEVE